MAWFSPLILLHCFLPSNLTTTYHVITHFLHIYTALSLSYQVISIMANACSTTRNCLFFLTLVIFCHELHSIEARNVETCWKKYNLRGTAGCSSLPDTKGIASPQPRKLVTSPSRSLHLHGTKSTSYGFVEAFRPTSPGNSPGVGHSIHNQK